MAKLAGECGIVLPRQAGRRRALLGAFVAAFRAASLERGRRYRELRRRAHHVPGLWCELADGGEIACTATVSWEGRPITAPSRVWWNLRRD